LAGSGSILSQAKGAEALADSPAALIEPVIEACVAGGR
jgi:hypothetical protein